VPGAAISSQPPGTLYQSAATSSLVGLLVMFCSPVPSAFNVKISYCYLGAPYYLREYYLGAIRRPGVTDIGSVSGVVEQDGLPGAIGPHLVDI